MGQLLPAAAIAAAALGAYFLYTNGYLPVQSKRALVFAGSMGAGGRQCYAGFTACTGYIRRVLKFRDTGEVRFLFTGRISKGSVDIFVLDRDKKPLLILNPSCPTGTLRAEKGARYYLMVRFDGADGDYQLEWE